MLVDGIVRQTTPFTIFVAEIQNCLKLVNVVLLHNELRYTTTCVAQRVALHNKLR